jgi:hypothetical protein
MIVLKTIWTADDAVTRECSGGGTYLDCAAYSVFNDCRMGGGAFAYLE